MNKVWITRSLPGALKTQSILKAKGYDAIAAPLLEISPPDTRPEPLPDEAILLITSKNGAQFLSEYTKKRHWPSVAVGDATASYMRRLGFESVTSARGTSQDVIALVRSTYAEQTRPIIHVAGRHVRGQITEQLCASGFKAEHRIFYESQPVTALPSLEFDALSYVLFYSPMAAETLRGFSPSISNMTAISISAETDKELAGLALKERLIAKKPAEKAMLRLLD